MECNSDESSEQISQFLCYLLSTSHSQNLTKFFLASSFVMVLSLRSMLLITLAGWLWLGYQRQRLATMQLLPREPHRPCRIKNSFWRQYLLAEDGRLPFWARIHKNLLLELVRATTSTADTPTQIKRATMGVNSITVVDVLGLFLIHMAHGEMPSQVSNQAFSVIWTVCPTLQLVTRCLS